MSFQNRKHNSIVDGFRPARSTPITNCESGVGALVGTYRFLEPQNFRVSAGGFRAAPFCIGLSVSAAGWPRARLPVDASTVCVVGGRCVDESVDAVVHGSFATRLTQFLVAINDELSCGNDLRTSDRDDRGARSGDPSSATSSKSIWRRGPCGCDVDSTVA